METQIGHGYGALSDCGMLNLSLNLANVLLEQLSDKNSHNVAIYEQSHSGHSNYQPAKLSVLPEAMDIIDEVVCTFIYCEQKEQVHRAAPRSTTISIAASTAVGSTTTVTTATTTTVC